MSWVAASVLCCYWLLWEISLCLDAQQARPLQQAHFILNLKHMGQPTFCLFCDLMVGVSCYYHEMYLSTPPQNTKNDRNLSLSIWDYSYATKNAFKSWLRLLSLTWSLLIVSLELLVSGCWVVACLAGIAVHYQMPKPDHTLPPRHPRTTGTSRHQLCTVECCSGTWDSHKSLGSFFITCKRNLIFVFWFFFLSIFLSVSCDLTRSTITLARKQLLGYNK